MTYPSLLCPASEGPILHPGDNPAHMAKMMAPTNDGKNPVYSNDPKYFFLSSTHSLMAISFTVLPKPVQQFVLDHASLDLEASTTHSSITLKY